MGVNASTLATDSNAVYQIRLQGVLDESWQDSIGDFRLVNYRTHDKDEAPQTLLIGTVPDQAALSGVLNLVYNLGLPLLDVQCLGTPLKSIDLAGDEPVVL